jgi:hypothetical protein
MALKMFQKNPDGQRDRGDLVRGLIALVICIAALAAADHSFDNLQRLVFFLLVGLGNFFLTIGIVFKEV